VWHPFLTHGVVFAVRFNDKRYVCWYELYPPHLISAATLPCESQKPKMHVNRTSGFNVNYIIAVTCIKLLWQFHKMVCMVNHINEHRYHSVCSKCPPSACTHDQMVTPASMMFWSKSELVCIKRFRRSSMSWIFVSYSVAWCMRVWSENRLCLG